MIAPEPANDAHPPPGEPLRPTGVERSAEERSEDDGMPEHPGKSADPAGWAASGASQDPAKHAPPRTAAGALTGDASAARGSE